MNFRPFQGLQDLPDLPDAARASREDLVAEMLGLQAHPLPGPMPAALRVSDRETPHEDPATQQLLTRRLGVARGEVDLARDIQDVKVTIQPEIGSAVALGAAVVVNPVVGVAALIAQKVMKDPRMLRMMKEPMPMDPKRMAYGGFKEKVDA